MTRLELMLAWLERHRDRDLIKIVTGIRGCGKSYLLSTYRKRLIENGVDPAHIVYLNLERPENRRLHRPEELMDLVDEHLPPEGRVYLMLDEIVELQEFDVALGGLFGIKRLDITVTSSNRRPVSDRFREYLSGHYVHTEMLPPSFRELPAPKSGGFQKRLNDCLLYGAMPYTFDLRGSHADTAVYLGGLWNTILVKDILTRNRLADSRLTERLLERIYEHLGEPESLRKIAVDSTIDGHEAAPNTVDSYLQALDESLLVRKLPKFDVFTGEMAKSGYRFYLSDLALGVNRYGDFPGDTSNALRNLVCLELLSRGGRVNCGRYDGIDFDFAVVDRGRAHCYQFAPDLENGEVPAAVLAPLMRLPRDMPKTVIAGNRLPRRRPHGVEFITLEEFLLGKDGEEEKERKN